MIHSRQNITFKLLPIAGIIFLAALTRIIPHWFNFSPIAAMCLFGAAYVKDKRLGLVLPLAAMWLSDFFLNNFVYASYYEPQFWGFTWLANFWVYAAFGLVFGIGLVLSKKITATNVILSALGSSLIFFLVTNFEVWFSGTMYPKTFAGLMACYIAGLPFLKNTLTGDLFYAAILFGSMEALVVYKRKWVVAVEN